MQVLDTYQSYLQCQKSISVEKMQELHQEIINEIGQDDDAREIYEELLKNAVRYLHFRSEWTKLSQQEKMDKDSSRTACHNSLIVKFNMLSRYLKLQGKEAAWRDELGYEENDPYNRKKIGDFGCYIAFVSALNAR